VAPVATTASGQVWDGYPFSIGVKMGTARFQRMPSVPERCMFPRNKMCLKMGYTPKAAIELEKIQ
jgi:hypothetical protein